MHEMTHEDVIEKVQQLATEIDFDQLVADKILERVGRRYRIIDLERLPKHVSAQVQSFSSDGLITKWASTKSAKQFLERIT